MPQHNRLPQLTIALIVVSIGLTLASDFGHDQSIAQRLFIEPYGIQGQFITFGNLSAVRSGQVWRLITPIFLHMSWMHIIFNMLWLKDLGSIIELKHNEFYLGIMVLIIGALSNTAQFYVNGPTFGGMSGVIYGLLGFLWIRGKCDPRYSIIIRKEIVVMMIVWFFLCLFGIIPNVANTVHGVGFGVGILWGYISAKMAIAAKT